MKKIFQYIWMTVALVATASCSNKLDDTLQPANNGNLQFVVSDFPVFGEGAQTRAIGTPDAGKTEWVNGDAIFVHLYSKKYGDQAVELKYNNGTWESNGGTLSYLENENPEITAVYAPCYEIYNGMLLKLKSDKFPGDGEYIHADTKIEGNTLHISFEDVERHYSRLRVVATPGVLIAVGCTEFYPAERPGIIDDIYHGLIPDENGNAYLYGTFAESATVTVYDENVETVLAEYIFTEATEAGKSYALYAGEKVEVDLSQQTETYTIKDDGYYVFTGTGSYGIKVASGNPRIILNGASITAGEEYDDNIVNALDIVADNSETTVYVMGTNNLTSNNGAGIYVKSGSTVIIKSDSRDNVLTAQAGDDSAGIGSTGYDANGENITCGNIYIENVTVNAYSSYFLGSSPGIGAYTSCGTITIKNATVTARGGAQGGVEYGGKFCPAIGATTVPDIVIENSTINAYRGGEENGSYADWIGTVVLYSPYDDVTPHTPGIQCGNGYIKNTTINKFLYDFVFLETEEEGSVTYDADGNPKEN